MSTLLGSYFYTGTSPQEGLLGSVVYTPVASVSSGGGGSGGFTFQRLFFNDGERLFPNGTTVARLFPVT